MLLMPVAVLLPRLLLGAVPSDSPLVKADTSCITMNTKNLPLATRQSPLDSVSFNVGKTAVKVCYGRPSARGRTMIGGEGVPYNRLWRTGANEPTMIHATGPISIAGVRVPGGVYSLYTIPGEKEWTVIVNRSVTQWGHESEYTADVKKQEVGTGKAKSEANGRSVETFTIRADPDAKHASAIVLEWEKTRVRIPIAAS